MYSSIDCPFCSTNFRGRDNNKAFLVTSLWICPYFMEKLEYLDKSPTPFIYGNIIIKTNKVPKIPLIPPPTTP